MAREITVAKPATRKLSHRGNQSMGMKPMAYYNCRNRPKPNRLRSNDMKKPTFEPGLTPRYTGSLRRAINKDGSFNVHRRGVTWRDINPYVHLINMPWPLFLSTVFLTYLAVNSLFALAYSLMGPQQLQGADAPTEFGRFLKDFFFSAQTLSTVGYGAMAPR